MADHNPPRVKRLATFRPKHEREFRALDDINPERLKLLASIAIEFNSAEDVVDHLLAAVLLTPIADEITSRINGIEGKVEIIKAACRESPTLSGGPAEAIGKVLTYFMECKGHRDALAHARLHNEADDVVFTYTKRGKTYEADISLLTLRVVHEHILHLNYEVIMAYRLAGHYFDKWTIEIDGIDPSEITSGQPFQDAFARLQAHLSLREIPEFPAELEVPQESEGRR